MKKHLFYILSVTLALALCLMGCGAGSKNGAAQAVSSAAVYSYGGAATPELPYPEAEEFEYDITSDIVMDEGSFVDITAQGVSAPPDTRKIILHANMELETMEYDAALAGIQKAVADAGGYIESQSQGGGTSYASRGRYQEERYAHIQARIPSEKLDSVMTEVGGVCNVLSQNTSMDDITDSYYDSQTRLETLRLQEDRLLAILEKAEKLEDVITLESALSDVRYQIERLVAALRRMDSQVTFSYLNLSLQEVVEYQQVQEKPRTYGERMREAAGDGVEAMVDGLQNFSLTAARVGPSLLVWVFIIGVIVLLIRAMVRANAKRRERLGLPPRRPPMTYTTGNPAQPRYERYPRQTPPAAQPASPESQPQGEGDGEQPK